MVIFGTLILQLIYTTSIHFLTQVDATPITSYGRCPIFWQTYPLIGLLILYLLGLLIFAFFIHRGVRDVHHMREEYLTTLGLGLLFTILQIISSTTSWLDFLDPYLTPSFWLLVGLISIHITSVCYPLFYVRIKLRREAKLVATEQLQFDQILQTPFLFEEFKKFTSDQFTVNYALFYERCRDLQILSRRLEYSKNELKVSEFLPIPKDSILELNETMVVIEPDAKAEEKVEPWVIDELKGIYKAFIDQEAYMRIELNTIIREEIQRKYENTEISMDWYDKALEEVYHLLWKESYPQYLEWRMRTRSHPSSTRMKKQNRFHK
ncbi:hypothetical protein K7432_009442 [Basidiobolus ranarum]|uniref:RGS domain-containing protein n=1 Tax=Basidiobolus ranarum TaxID=34480 RepID=A0ABR2VX67_9FUNG